MHKSKALSILKLLQRQERMLTWSLKAWPTKFSKKLIVEISILRKRYFTYVPKVYGIKIGSIGIKKKADVTNNGETPKP